MATTTNLTTLKINYLTQEQYDAAVTSGTINSDELYFTPAATELPSNGTSGQILMINSSGDIVWGNLEMYDGTVTSGGST